MRPASQRFFINSCIYLWIWIISYLATFLGTNSLSVLMCHKAVNQSINSEIKLFRWISLKTTRVDIYVGIFIPVSSRTGRFWDWFVCLILHSCQYGNAYIGGQSQIYVNTGERTQIQIFSHPSNNRGQREHATELALVATDFPDISSENFSCILEG